MKYKFTVTLLLITTYIFSQGNCIIYPEGSGEREACLLSHKSIEFEQGSKESQLLFDEAINIGPKYAWAYYQKSVPYLKRGFLTEGLSILNEAVKLEPLEYLCYRAYWYWQYKNYELCVKDLETYYALSNHYVQFTPGGEKNMKVILALAYAKTMNYKKAITVLNEHIKFAVEDDFIGLSDYHTLGFLHYKNNDIEQAITSLNKQLQINSNIAETYYYLGLSHKRNSDFNEARIELNKALLKFKSSNRYNNINSGFPIYEIDILKEIENLNTIKA